MPWSFMQKWGSRGGPGVHWEGAEQQELLETHFKIGCSREAEKATWQDRKHTHGRGKKV